MRGHGVLHYQDCICHTARLLLGATSYSVFICSLRLRIGVFPSALFAAFLLLNHCLGVWLGDIGQAHVLLFFLSDLYYCSEVARAERRGSLSSLWLMKVMGSQTSTTSYETRFGSFSPDSTSTSVKTGASSTTDKHLEGCKFYDGASDIWARYSNVARLNPPTPTLPLPCKYYGQPFFKGFSWENKL